ncbi:MAG TPA: sigma-70 family RNA polymerase sigma factor [Steroidobacteraceae bacterium]|jgi:RNA polymerase sigma-70 factor (ECF subfamily)|nr:sigma-70 family RNA polymerase sigma factor [Steroidobacteraceae bacterium]
MTDKRRRFEAQVLSHLDAAYRFARWLSSAPGHADDVVQEALLRAFRGFDAFQGGDARAWLFAIVRNCHVTAMSQQRRRSFVPLDCEEFVTPEPGPEDAVLQRDASRTVARLLAALAAEHREVLVLREFEEMSYGDIARVLEIPIGTVMSRLARARTALKAITADKPGVFA